MSDETDGLNGNEIAIVGLALRVPGANDPATFFDNLRRGVESIRPLTEDELRANGESPERMAHPRYVRATADLTGMEDFDGDFFGFGPKESAILDPQHRQFLECAYEALESAGHVPSTFEGPIGVYAGCGMGTYFYVNILSNRDLVESVGTFLLRHTGNDKDFLATRLSYLLDLRGPSVNIQTACSTSLVAVHQAAQSLMSRECDMAIAGGVTIELPHRRGYIFEEGEILSPDGHCHAFDHRAAGTVFGSGVGAVVLRRLEDALRDGDVIHAVIKGTAVNNDGSGKAGYLAPSVDGQAAAIVEAHSLADVDPRSISYVECHGTGTYLGDPIEVEALTQAFRQGTRDTGFCRLGSVKANIGHLDTAAGVVGLIKTTLALENEVIPPSISFEKPNPAIDFPSTPFLVNDALRPWPRGNTVRRAGVNSLGVGGTNCHVVLEEAPSPKPRAKSSGGPAVLSFSAKTRSSLDRYAAKLASFLEASPEVDLDDVAHTLRVGRARFDKRRVLAARDAKEAVALLRSLDTRRVFTLDAPRTAPEVVFMFPGGGAQYIAMGRGLYREQPEFKKAVDEGISHLRPLVDFDPLALLFESDDDADAVKAKLERPSVQLPLTLIVEVALARLWMSWGIRPAALIGHSMGENAAACVAGVLSFEDAVALVHLRGTLFDSITGGGMLSVALPAERLRPMLGDALDLAVENGPELSVASGPKAALDALAHELAAKEIEHQRIRIDIAAHSRMLEPILERFREFLRGLRLKAPTIPFVSNSTGQLITDAQATNPDYWVSHLRGTIRFSKGIETLAATPGRVFLEVGPGRTLGSLAKQHGAVSAQLVLASLRHEDETTDDSTFFATTLGRLAALDLPVPLERLERKDARKVVLPTYAFDHHRYFIEPAAKSVVAETTSLARAADLESFGYRTTWQRKDSEILVDGEPRAHRALVFLDDAGVGEALVRAIRARGGSAIVVEPGDAYAKRSAEHFVLAPENADDAATLVRELVAHGGLPEEIVHLWLLTPDESFRPGSSFFHRNVERGFHSLFALSKALLTEASSASTRLTVVSNGMHGVGDEVPLHPEKSTALGPVLVLPHEAQLISARAIDLDLPVANPNGKGALAIVRELASTIVRKDDATAAFAALLLEELDAKSPDSVVAYRGGRRWARTFVESRVEPATTSPVREGAVVLVTGGLGGISLAIASDLARRARCRFIFLSRRAFPPRDRWGELRQRASTDSGVMSALERIAAIEAAGGEVVVETADVTNVEDVRRVVEAARARFGAIHGVVHAAGVIRDSLAVTKTHRDVEQVFAPKIHGTRVLDEVLAGIPLDFFVVFSSTSATTGPVGQMDYVAANSFLDAFAEERTRRTGQKTVSIAWGIWTGVGMAHEAMKRSATRSAGATGSSALHREWLEDPSGRRVLGSTWSPKTETMLEDHRTADGRAVVPGTGYVDAFAQAVREYGESGTFELRDLVFLRPLAVGDDEAREVRTRLVATREGYDAELRSRASSGSVSGFAIHAQASIRLHPKVARASIDIPAIESRTLDVLRAEPGKSLRSAQENFLRFGPRFRVLREQRLGKGEAFARLSLDEGLAGEVPRHAVHPGLLDLATGFAMGLIEGYDPRDSLWVPVSYGSIVVLDVLPARIVSWVRNAASNRVADGTASFDVTLADESGRVLVDIRNFSIRRLGATSFGAIPEPTRAELEIEPTESEARATSPAEMRLRAQLALGITESEGAEAFVRALAAGRRRAIVTSIPLGTLVDEASRVETEKTDVAKFERPDLGSAYVAPTDDVERALASFWEELLGVSGIGIHDGFFDLGGHSLIAVRLFAKVKKAFGVDLPISVLFEAPTIAKIAELVRRARGDSPSPVTDEKPRFTHLVALHPGEGRSARPFFLVAGMFGNVLNLRHLGHLLGDERPFYALQARGLFGDVPPHETFEEMARDYIAEMRAVQPKGPYSIGGFSGGGLTAYEIAQTLRAEGEEVDIVVLLDTPLPVPEPLELVDRMALQAHRIREKGPAYVAEWAKNRVAWEIGKLRKRSTEELTHDAESFHNEAIEAAFRRALVHYDVKPYDGLVVLFRPRLDRRYEVTRNRFVNGIREYVYEDNRWSLFASRLEVHEVPGDHDSMVLEPNVRVLASRMRAVIARAESRTEKLAAE